MPYTFSNRLPDPDYKIRYSGEGGDTTNATAGPGFASVKLTSDQKVMVSRTNSGRVLAKGIAAQKWNIDIDYHPMTQDEFRPIDAFLQSKQGALTPFFVALPQYNTPKNTNWVNALKDRRIDGNPDPAYSPNPNSGNAFVFHVQLDADAGDTSIVIGSDSWSPTAMGGTEVTNIPNPGEVFTIEDATNSNHKKVNMITHVETNNTYATTNSRPSNSARLRLGISPPLSKSISGASSGRALTFINPLFQVIMPTAVRSYSLNTDNLYKFSLKLEEYL